MKGPSTVWKSDWLEADAYLDALTPDARVILLELLSSSADVRAAAIGRLHGRVDASVRVRTGIRARP